MHELVIRNGTVVDGTGAPAQQGDVAVTDGVITDVGRVEGRAQRHLDADGLLVTPGFVDIHTHYDGQVTWDQTLSPSCWHGVTTLVMGNCGVGFAPCRPDRREWLIGLMEGVEDIPGAALSAGIQWNWESFPEYLDHIDTLPKVMDIGTQVPHGAVRSYVMGERGAANEPATSDDIAAMAALVREGLQAGALGVSTSRTIVHRAIDGEPVPGTFAAEDELFGIGRVLGELGRGVFELAPAGALGEDLAGAEREMDWIARMADEIRRPITFALSQNDADPDHWRKLLALADDAVARGVPVRPQTHGRTVSLLIGLSTFHPLQFTAAWAPYADMSIDELVERLAEPEVRERFVRELSASTDEMLTGFFKPHRMFPLGDPPEYEPAPDRSIAAMAEREHRSPWDVLLDLLLANHGRELINSPILNYSDLSLDPVYEMLMSPATAFGLGDGGAHVGQTCDASTTTTMLSHWTRDRKGPQIPLETAVHKITGATAALYGLTDRGRIAPGFKADLNLIDHASVQLHRPELVHDLPGGAKRLIQRSSGYHATIVGGKITFQDGEDTGARPGRLLRGTPPGPR